MKPALDEIYTVKKRRAGGQPIDLRKLSVDPGMPGHLRLAAKTMPNGNSIKSLDLVHPSIVNGGQPGSILGTLLKPELTQIAAGKLVFCGLEKAGRSALVFQEWECIRLEK